jgi:hypothetical protein
MFPPIDTKNEPFFFERRLPLKLNLSLKTIRPTSELSKIFGYYPPEITKMGKNI